MEAPAALCLGASSAVPVLQVTGVLAASTTLTSVLLLPRGVRTKGLVSTPPAPTGVTAPLGSLAANVRPPTSPAPPRPASTGARVAQPLRPATGATACQVRARERGKERKMEKGLVKGLYECSLLQSMFEVQTLESYWRYNTRHYVLHLYCSQWLFVGTTINCQP
jgi:hypothetical protein